MERRGSVFETVPLREQGLPIELSLNQTAQRDEQRVCEDQLSTGL